MRQKVRRIIIIISLLLFPITLNYLSPYVSIDGAMIGIISGSLIVFILMLITGIFFGRSWCSWVCPIACLSEMCQTVNNKNVNVKKLKIIRYSIFTIWASVLLFMFILAGGIKGINPLHLTDYGISVDEPFKYITYYLVLILFFIVTLLIGKRGACHSFCWMSPFLVFGFTIGKILKIPQLRIKAKSSACTGCGACNKKCPMSINVSSEIKSGCIKSSDCILCGECADNCKNKVLYYSFK
ncbi:MAG: 4Fe-4S binding protein [Clostridia bacterium]|nr:4Fe-4S binding protein [Clostridia bacterium]